jgi:murein L,D-transpeptidase YcbB/YkuD
VRWLLCVLVLALSSAAETAAPCDSQLCEIVTAGRLEGLRWPDFTDHRARIQKFYEPSSYTYAWVHNGAPTEQAMALIEILRGSALRGLNPEDYDISHWAGTFTSEASPAEFDLALTVSVMRYVSDLHFGKVNPGLFRDAAAAAHLETDIAEFVREKLVNASSPAAALMEMEPPYPGYHRTQQALQSYLAIGRESEIVLPPIKKTVEPGAVYEAAPALSALLRRFGDLTADIPLPNNPRYDGALVEAVKRFQTRHGLEPDGKIGKTTLAQLNTPVSQRIRQLQLALERWRWAPHNFSRPPIVVNIPEFKLRAMNREYSTELEMKVVVGQAYGHQTPVFSAGLQYVVFRPYWNVPASIQRAELLPKLMKDRAYLIKNHFQVVAAQGKVVSEGEVDENMIARLRSGELHIRQVPGSENSLGLVAFMFPNEYDVYLHATPATVLFSKSRRDFSHGCIRAEKPEELAAWVLRAQPGWTRERIREAMQGEKTFQVILARPIPVLIVYATAVVPEEGDVHFFQDLYGQDAQLEELLAKGYPYPSSKPRGKPTSGARAPRPRE